MAPTTFVALYRKQENQTHRERERMFVFGRFAFIWIWLLSSHNTQIHMDIGITNFAPIFTWCYCCWLRAKICFAQVLVYACAHNLWPGLYYYKVLFNKNIFHYSLYNVAVFWFIHSWAFEMCAQSSKSVVDCLFPHSSTFSLPLPLAHSVARFFSLLRFQCFFLN